MVCIGVKNIPKYGKYLYRLNWMIKKPKIVIVIPNWNGKGLLRNCLETIRKNTSYPSYEILVVDNASKDDSVEMVKKEFPGVWLICNKENLGFPKACNQGIKCALEKYDPDYVFPLNNDMKIIQKGWLAELVEVAERDDRIGVVNCKMIYPDGRLQYAAGWVRPWGEWSWAEMSDPEKIVEVDVIGGQALLIKREVIKKIGLFDEGFSPFMWEDFDYCFRVKKAGYKIVSNPKVTLIHYGKASIKKKGEDFTFFIRGRNKIRFILLNFPLKWLILETSYDILLFFLEKKNPKVGLTLTNVKLRKNFSKKLVFFLKAYEANLKNLREIVWKRKNRTMKIAH